MPPNLSEPLGSLESPQTILIITFAIQTRRGDSEYINYTPKNKYPQWGIIYTNSKVFTFDKFSEYFKVSSPAGLNLLPMTFKKIN